MKIIGYYWETHFPDWRFAQLMMNFICWYGGDPFYLEDEDFIRYFVEYMSSLGIEEEEYARIDCDVWSCR